MIVRQNKATLCGIAVWANRVPCETERDISIDRCLRRDDGDESIAGLSVLQNALRGDYPHRIENGEANARA